MIDLTIVMFSQAQQTYPEALEPGNNQKEIGEGLQKQGKGGRDRTGSVSFIRSSWVYD